MIEDNDIPDRINLGVITNKRNSFLDYLASEGKTLHLNSSSFLNKNRIVGLVIRTIRDRMGVRSHLWLDIEYMA
jgi:hypothetical protein